MPATRTFSTLLIVLVGVAWGSRAAAQSTSSSVMLGLGTSVTKGVVSDLTKEGVGWATSALGISPDPNAEVVKALEEISMQLAMIEEEIAQTNILLQESLCQDAAGNNTLDTREYIDTLMSEGPDGFQGIIARAQQGTDVTSDLRKLFRDVLNGDSTNAPIETLLNEMHDTLMDAGLSQGGITACVLLIDPPTTTFDDRFYYQNVKNFLDFFFAYQAEGAVLLVNAYHWQAVQDWITAGNDPSSITQDNVSQICQSPVDSAVMDDCEKAEEAFNLVADHLRLQYAHGGAPYSSGTPNDSTATFQYDPSDPQIEIDNDTGIVWVRNYSDFCSSGGYSSTCCSTTSASPCGPGVGAYDLSTFSRYNSSAAVTYGNAPTWRPASADEWNSLLHDWKKDEVLSTYLESGPPGFAGTADRVFFTGDTFTGDTEATVSEGSKTYHFVAKEVACLMATPLKKSAATQPLCGAGFGALMHGSKDHTNSKSPCYNANATEHGELSTIQSPFFDLLYNIQKDTCKSDGHPNGQTFYAGPPGWLLKYRSYKSDSSTSEDTGTVSVSKRASQYHWPVRDSSQVTCTNGRTRTNLSGQQTVPTLCGDDFDAWFDKWVVPPPDLDSAPQVTAPAPITVTAPTSSGPPVPHYQVTVPVDFKNLVSAVDPKDGELPVSCQPGNGTAFQLGVTQISCLATNSAGITRMGTFTVHVVYPFSGFAAPLDSSQDVVAGNDVAIRFGLGGDRGGDVVAFGGPASAQADCATGEAVTVLTPTDSSSGLTYDAASNTYRYDWSTDPGWGGQCRLLVLDLVDGARYSTLVQFDDPGTASASGGGGGGCAIAATSSSGLLPIALGLLLLLAWRLRWSSRATDGGSAVTGSSGHGATGLMALLGAAAFSLLRRHRAR